MVDNKFSILLVDDELNLQKILKLNLELEGYDVTIAENGIIALEKLTTAHFDLMILDIMLPELDGISVCETSKLKYPDLPIIILSAKTNSADRILGLKKGADDYLNKPFNLEELLLRVQKLIAKNVLIHTGKSNLDEYFFGNFNIKFKEQIAFNSSDNNAIDLTKKETLLLKLLIENKNEVVTREKILQTVWGYQIFPNTRTIDNFILNFRKYFEADSKNPLYFHSIRGVGYKFTDI